MSTRRPVGKKSITTYLGSKKNFVRVKEGYALAIWRMQPLEQQKRLRREKSVDVAKLAETIASIFNERGITEILVTDLAKELRLRDEAISINSLSAHWIPSSSAVNIVERIESSKKRRIARFNPNYKAARTDDLPVLVSIQQTAREILAQQPEKRMLMLSLKQQIMKKLSHPSPSVYSALSRMADLEKTEENKKTYCALRSDSGRVYAEYLEKITDPTLKIAVNRAIEMLNKTHVDMGLLQLGRLFENTLEKLLLAMEKKSLLKTAKKAVKDMNLHESVKLAGEEKIILDSSALQHLRVERNERAHGTTLSLQESRALLVSCRTLVPFFLEYLILLEQALLKLPA